MTLTSWILTAGFAGLVVLGMPFAFAIAISVLAILVLSGIEPMLLPQTMRAWRERRASGAARAMGASDGFIYFTSKRATFSRETAFRSMAWPRTTTSMASALPITTRHGGLPSAV